MHEHTQRLIDHLREQHAVVRAALDTIPAEARSRRPSPDRWSAAEIVEHVAITEARMVMFLQRAPLSGEPIGEAPVMIGDPRRILDRSVRVDAPEQVIPSGTIDAEEAWRRLDEARAQLESELIARDGVDLSGVVRDHPFLGTLNLYQWVHFTGGHAARHAMQIRELSES